MNETLKRSNKNKRITARDQPAYLPFKTTAHLLSFNYANEEQYADLVDYLLYLGGVNASIAAAKYIKNCFKFSEEFFTQMTWTGSEKFNIVDLKDTHFAAACEEALSSYDLVYTKSKKDEFVFVMTKALKSAMKVFDVNV